MIIITSSSGVYKYLPITKEIFKLIGCSSNVKNQSSTNFGYFGLCQDHKTNTVYFASRERGTKIFRKKKSAATTIYSLQKESSVPQPFFTLNGIEDVHQIALDEFNFYLTDTGRNRIWVQDRALEKPPKILSIGWRRKDINHINAIKVSNGQLLVGLNNRGRSSEIIAFNSFAKCNSFRVFPMRPSQKFALTGINHTHDLELCEDAILFCASNDGILYRLYIDGDVVIPRKLMEYDPWLRGIAVYDQRIWVGVSPVASRTERYNTQQSAKLIEYSLTAGAIIDEHILDKIGQINDILWLDG